MNQSNLTGYGRNSCSPNLNNWLITHEQTILEHIIHLYFGTWEQNFLFLFVFFVLFFNWCV